MRAIRFLLMWAALIMPILLPLHRHGTACSGAPPAKAALRAGFVEPPALFTRHAPGAEFCGPTVVSILPGELLIRGYHFRSTDGGRSQSGNSVANAPLEEE